MKRTARGLRFFDRKWWADQPEDARTSATNLGIMLIGQFAIVITALITSPDHPSYHKVHGGLFIVSTVAVLIFFALKGALRTMLRHTWSTFARPHQATLPQVVDAMRILMLTVALVSLTFIVDLSFFRHGFRIGGAAAVSLFLVGKAIVEMWRATRS